MNKPKLLFIYDQKQPEYWMDGLYAALQLMEMDFEITKHNLQYDGGIKDVNFDFILGWGAFASPVDNVIVKMETKAKKGLCIAGNAMPIPTENIYDALFYETSWIRRNYLSMIDDTKCLVKKAFGVNTDIYFKPDMGLPIVWDYIGVGAFADWKRWHKMKDKKGTRLVIGEVQKDNHVESMRIIDDLVTNGVMVSNMVHPFDLAHYYQYSRTLYIPSNQFGGGERAVLEARSCGLTVEVEEDNQKLLELANLEKIPDHHTYANQLTEGIESII